MIDMKKVRRKGRRKEVKEEGNIDFEITLHKTCIDLHSQQDSLLRASHLPRASSFSFVK